MASAESDHRNALPTGYRLSEFRIESILGHGGFGITYRAFDEELHQDVAIKEYLPREVAIRDRDSTVLPISESDRDIFEWGLERFLDEARTLARFQHPTIIGVRRFLRANGTAYLVMDYCEGESLEQRLKAVQTLPADQVAALLEPLLDALEVLHKAGVTHRDIKPGNIYLKADGSPLLLDFGAARQALAQHSRSVTAMATPGYAAFEQYSSKGKQGPWTDIYGLGATLYRCVTGQRPPDATDRMLDDELVPASQVASEYPHALLDQIDAALKLKPEERPQSVAEWREVDASAPSPPASIQTDNRSTESELSTVTDPVTSRKPASTGFPWGVVLILLGLAFGVYFFQSSAPDTGPPPTIATPSEPRPAPRDTSPAEVRPEPPESVRLRVTTTPSDARIRIMNIEPVYRDGIELEPGQYDLEITARGYRTHRRWYSLPAGDRQIDVALERIPERPATGTVSRDRLQDGTPAPEMVFIRGGTFTMGSPLSEAGRSPVGDGDWERQHRVRVEDVWIGKYAVTFAEYDRFARATGRNLPPERGWGRDRRPVINVSWHDAAAYAEWLSQQTGQQYRLPTEAEWEYAARAGTTTARYWGKGIGRNQANCNGCGSRWDGRQTAPVGSFAPNPWGLYDMLGNVWEWTCSAFDAGYGGAEQRCDAHGRRRAVRGGSWGDAPDGVRSADRLWLTPGARNSSDLGFRLARSP